MLKQITAPDHVIALALDGTLTGEGLRDYRKVLEKKLQEHEHIGLYIDVTKLTDMTANSVVEGTKADMELFGHLKQLNKCALISDKEWPKTAILLADKLFPKIEIKVFPSSESDAALSWVAEKSEKSEKSELSVAKSGAIRFLPTNKDSVMAFEVDGVLTASEIPNITQRLETFLEGQDSVRLLARMKNYSGFEPSILMHSGGLFSMKISAMKKVERYAIVGAPNWMSKVVETVNPLFPKMEMKSFSTEQESEALAWLDAKLIK